MEGHITILDFEIGSVFQYKIKDRYMQSEECEKFIEDKGHNITKIRQIIKR